MGCIAGGVGWKKEGQGSWSGYDQLTSLNILRPPRPSSQVLDTISVLRGIKAKYEMHHKIRITDGALISAAELSNR